MWYLGQPLSPLECNFSTPEPVPVEVGEAVDNDGHRQNNGKGAKDGTETSNHLTHSRHWSDGALKNKQTTLIKGETNICNEYCNF